MRILQDDVIPENIKFLSQALEQMILIKNGASVFIYYIDLKFSLIEHLYCSLQVLTQKNLRSISLFCSF